MRVPGAMLLAITGAACGLAGPLPAGLPMDGSVIDADSFKDTTARESAPSELAGDTVSALDIAYDIWDAATLDLARDELPAARPRDATDAPEDSRMEDLPVDRPGTCAAPLSLCGGACRNLTSDDGNCGRCGLVCATGTRCAGAACVSSCPVGSALCAGVCRDLSSDISHCGSCGNACTAGHVCMAGVCRLVCPVGLVPCGARCVDTFTDVGNCGACGNVCSAGDGCRDGACQRLCARSPEYHVCDTRPGGFGSGVSSDCAVAPSAATVDSSAVSAATVAVWIRVSSPLVADGVSTYIVTATVTERATGRRVRGAPVTFLSEGYGRHPSGMIVGACQTREIGVGYTVLEGLYLRDGMTRTNLLRVTTGTDGTATAPVAAPRWQEYMMGRPLALAAYYNVTGSNPYAAMLVELVP